MKCVLEVVCWWCVWLSMNAVVLDGDLNAQHPVSPLPNGLPGLVRVEQDPLSTLSMTQPTGPAGSTGTAVPTGTDIPGFGDGEGNALEQVMSPITGSPFAILPDGTPPALPNLPQVQTQQQGLDSQAREQQAAIIQAQAQQVSAQVQQAQAQAQAQAQVQQAQAQQAQAQQEQEQQALVQRQGRASDPRLQGGLWPGILPGQQLAQAIHERVRGIQPNGLPWEAQRVNIVWQNPSASEQLRAEVQRLGEIMNTVSSTEGNREQQMENFMNAVTARLTELATKLEEEFMRERTHIQASVDAWVTQYTDQIGNWLKNERNTVLELRAALDALEIDHKFLKEKVQAMDQEKVLWVSEQEFERRLNEKGEMVEKRKCMTRLSRMHRTL